MEPRPYRLIATRMAAAAAALSLVFGALSYVLSSRALEADIVAMAAAEARVFASINAAELDDLVAPGGEAKAGERLAHFLATRSDNRSGHFILAELYDGRRRHVAEASRPGVEAVPIDREAHSFPEGEEPWADQVHANGGHYVRVVVPLRRDDGTAAFFEGVYHVAEARLAQRRSQAVWTMVATVGVVLGTTLFLWPVVLLLHRNVLQLSRNLLKANLDALDLMGGAIAKRDSDTHFHNHRVTLYAIHLAEAIGLPRQAMQELIKGAFLHDVGKIAIPDAILLKPAKLSEEEFAVMKTHVLHGVDIVRRSDWLRQADCVVRHHHERFDGGGYPDGLAGERIPIAARVFAIADVFDALTSRRPYKAPMPLDQALEAIRAEAGRHFDPALVRTFEAIAPGLYARFGRKEDETVVAALVAATMRYFDL